MKSCQGSAQMVSTLLSSKPPLLPPVYRSAEQTVPTIGVNEGGTESADAQLSLN